MTDEIEQTMHFGKRSKVDWCPVCHSDVIAYREVNTVKRSSGESNFTVSPKLLTLVPCGHAVAEVIMLRASPDEYWERYIKFRELETDAQT